MIYKSLKYLVLTQMAPRSPHTRLVHTLWFVVSKPMRNIINGIEYIQKAYVAEYSYYSTFIKAFRKKFVVWFVVSK